MISKILEFFGFKKKHPVEIAISQVMKKNNLSREHACQLKVELIKQVRENTGLGLKEAKAEVDNYF
jgi:ribosomal protein L7/L12